MKPLAIHLFLEDRSHFYTLKEEILEGTEEWDKYQQIAESFQFGHKLQGYKFVGGTMLFYSRTLIFRAEGESMSVRVAEKLSQGKNS